MMTDAERRIHEEMLQETYETVSKNLVEMVQAMVKTETRIRQFCHSNLCTMPHQCPERHEDCWKGLDMVTSTLWGVADLIKDADKENAWFMTWADQHMRDIEGALLFSITVLTRHAITLNNQDRIREEERVDDARYALESAYKTLGQIMRLRARQNDLAKTLAALEA